MVVTLLISVVKFWPILPNGEPERVLGVVALLEVPGASKRSTSLSSRGVVVRLRIVREGVMVVVFRLVFGERPNHRE